MISTGRLIAARQDRALFDSSAKDHQAAALELATALGWYRLTGIDPDPSVDGSLPIEIAVAAAELLKKQLYTAIGEALALSKFEVEQLDNYALEDKLCWFFETAMDALAAYEAILESEFAHGSVISGALGKRISDYSAALFERRELLQGVFNSQLFKNWRAALNNAAPPWWLQDPIYWEINWSAV